MKSTTLQMIVRLSRGLAGEGALNPADDTALLARFADARDETAFAAILDRHSRLVWGVCRGLLPNDADAEDVFQATFVALFRGAATIRHPRSLAPWLHSTATRIAKKVRLAAARRSRREHRAAKAEAAPAAMSDEAWEALALAVHDEIARLPATLRAAFVLCVLQGHRHQDAAAQLGVPVGTVSARVSRARNKLMDRLRARGLTPVVAAPVVACAAATVSAGVPQALLLSVCRHLADGFASVSKTILDLAAPTVGGMSMTGKWLSVAMLIATIGGMWYANAQEKADAPPGFGPAVAQEKQPRVEHVDRHGDPLPPGALARLGTVRLRHGGSIGAAAFSPNGRLLATGGTDKMVRLWDAATGKPVASLSGHTQNITAVAFSPDGRTLASASSDTMVLLWDVTGLTPVERRELPPTKAGQPLQLWEDLAAADAGRADRAVRMLAAAPAQAVPLVRERLKPVAGPDAERVKRLIADLNSNQFTVRDQAARELDRLGDLVEPALQQALERGPGLEVRRRIDGLLAKCAETATMPAPEQLRVLRAVEVLERIGGAEARRILETLARGAESRLTRAAAASARRLARRAESMP